MPGAERAPPHDNRAAAIGTEVALARDRENGGGSACRRRRDVSTRIRSDGGQVSSTPELDPDLESVLVVTERHSRQMGHREDEIRRIDDEKVPRGDLPR